MAKGPPPKHPTKREVSHAASILKDRHRHRDKDGSIHQKRSDVHPGPRPPRKK